MKKIIIAVMVFVIAMGAVLTTLSMNKTEETKEEVCTVEESISEQVATATEDLVDYVEDYNDKYYNEVLPAVEKELSGRGYSEEEIRDIATLVMFELGC